MVADKSGPDTSWTACPSNVHLPFAHRSPSRRCGSRVERGGMKISFLALMGLAVTITALPAQATPYAGQYDYLTTNGVAITGADGAKWLLTVQASKSGAVESRPEQYLYVDLSRCAANACTSVGRWVRPLISTEATIRPALGFGTASLTSDARLHTVLAGRSLEVVLAADAPSGSNFTFAPTSPDYRPHVTSFAFATGTLRVGSLSCSIATKAGEIGEFTGADTVGNDARTPRTPMPATLPAGFLTGQHAPHC